MPTVTIYVYKVNLGDRGSCPVCEAWDGHESRNRQDLPAIPNPACLAGRESCFCEVDSFQKEEEESGGGGGGPHVDEDSQPDGGGGGIGSGHFPDLPDGGGGGGGGGGQGWGDASVTFPDGSGGEWDEFLFDSWYDSKGGGG